MEANDNIIKQARECHTKLAWESLFDTYGETLANTTNSKLLQEVFRLLSGDSQCMQYSPVIFGQLIRGCLASWNLELGQEIAEFAKKIPSAQIAIPAAQLYLEAGQVTITREIAHRTLRLTGLSAVEHLQLEMIICNSYSEESKHSKALKILNRIENDVRSPELKPAERADFLLQIARMQFLLGQYQQAGELFYEASKTYRKLEDWDQAARSIFNTAASYLNAGVTARDVAFAMVEECRRLAEEFELSGPLAHCEAAYGMDCYQHGNFAGAKEHFRRSLDYLPMSDKSYRRQHILSMLAKTYLGMGRYHLARKFGQQTIDLVALDESERFKNRYVTLEAELFWHDGEIERSQEILKEAVRPLDARGVHTLEELASLSRYALQSAWLNDGNQSLTAYKIDDALTKNQHSWLEYKHALGHVFLNQNNYHMAQQYFNQCLDRGREVGDRLNVALGLHGNILGFLRQRKPDQIGDLEREFEIAIGRLGDSPFKTHVHLIKAAIAYQSGDFDEFVKIFKFAGKGSRLAFHDKFVINCVLATIEGRSPRINAGWQTQMLAQFVRTYFAPSISVSEPRYLVVSGHYPVSLERHSSLAEIIQYLLNQPGYSATAEQVQTEVWQQSTNMQGWQQKIRNSIMRLRDFFPYTIAPIIVHHDQIALFNDAIEIQTAVRQSTSPEDEVLQLVTSKPLSSAQISDRLNMSSATTKRLLKKMIDQKSLTSSKQGRNVYYEPHA